MPPAGRGRMPPAPIGCWIEACALVAVGGDSEVEEILFVAERAKDILSLALSVFCGMRILLPSRLYGGNTGNRRVTLASAAGVPATVASPSYPATKAGLSSEKGVARNQT